MTRASAAQLERARQLLAHEGGDADSAEAHAAAAGRVYDNLDAQLAPLLGSAGVRSLLARSARLTRYELSSFSEVAIQSSTTLRDALRALDSAVAAATAAALFGTFFALMENFIGERLTIQVLRRAWPTIEETASGETKK